MQMGQHGPEAPHRLGGNADAQRRQISLAEGAHEFAPPARGLLSRAGQERPREASPHPEVVEALGLHFVERQAAQLVIGNAARQRLGALAQQVGASTAQNQKPGRRSDLEFSSYRGASP